MIFTDYYPNALDKCTELGLMDLCGTEDFCKECPYESTVEGDEEQWN